MHYEKARSRYHLGATLVAALLGTSGCTDVFGLGCKTDLRFGVRVRVLEAASGQPIAANATIVVVDGQYRDSITVAADTAKNSLAIPLAENRPGDYTVRVTKPGYRTWMQSRVRAESDRCGVKTAEVTASIERM